MASLFRIFLVSIWIMGFGLSLSAHEKNKHSAPPVPRQETPISTIEAKSPEQNTSWPDVLWWLPPAHPVLVHFPIALLVLAGILGMAGLLGHESVLPYLKILMVIGALGALAAMTSGLYFEEYTPHHHGGSIDPVMRGHEILGITSAIFACLLAIAAWKIKKESSPALRKLFYLSAVLLLLLISITAHFGGILVHRFGVGL